MDWNQWLGVISMFLNGFIMLTPHRIAMLCANHVIKRFHLPPATVPLFIYKIHNPMELSSLISTFLANVVTWIADAAFSKKEDEAKKKMFQRIISCITMWFMFLTTVVSYFLFISGDDYGNFELFYWSVVSITFANGMASNFGFGVNYNATMYGAGMPTSSFVTFIIHNTYKYFYNIYFWDDYDYKLVVLQYWVTIFFIALTDGLWTWDQVNQMGGTGPPGGGGSGTEIDISQAPTGSNNDGGFYSSGGTKIKVTKVTVQPAGTSTNWVGYKHSNSASAPFKLLKITHSDQLMQSTDGSLSDNMSMTINDQGAIYVYYKDPTQIHQPKVICISPDGSISKNKWYAAGGSATDWSKVTSGNLPTSNPTSVNETNLETATKNSTLIVTGTDYVIKLDKRPNVAGNNIKYRTGSQDITVEKTDGNTQGNGGVPNNYVRYKHSASSFKLGSIILNGSIMSDIKEYGTNVEAVYVYYHNSDISDRQFPLIVCVKIDANTRTYYKRGNSWVKITTALADKDPDDPTVKTLLGGEFTTLIAQYEVKLENQSTYKGRPQAGSDITVTEDTTIDGFIGYEHSVTNSSMTINMITHKGKPIRGIQELDRNSTIDIDANNKVWVFYKKDEQDTPKLETPLLLYYRKKDTGGGNATNHWYGRGKKWEEHGNMNDINASGDLANLDQTKKDRIESKLNAILNRQGKFLELVCFDNGYHWSPILMLSFSLGTIYAFYPTISPYSLIDPERAEKIDLWVVAICAIPNLFLAILDLDIPGGPVGPGKKWIKYRQDYNPWEIPDHKEVHRDWYHYVWIIGGVPYLICLYVFFTTLHFPEGFIGRHVKDNPFVVGFFSVIFNTVQELMESVAFGGGAVQSHDGFVGSINQFNVLLMLTTCVSTMFSCDGYLKTISIHNILISSFSST